MQNHNWEVPHEEKLLWQYWWIVFVQYVTSYSVGGNDADDQQPRNKWYILAEAATVFHLSLL